MPTLKNTNQPELVNDWDVPFNGRAETATGHVYWYVKDGKRYPLKPVTVQMDVLPALQNPKHERNST